MKRILFLLCMSTSLFSMNPLVRYKPALHTKAALTLPRQHIKQTILAHNYLQKRDFHTSRPARGPITGYVAGLVVGGAVRLVGYGAIGIAAVAGTTKVAVVTGTVGGTVATKMIGTAVGGGLGLPATAKAITVGVATAESLVGSATLSTVVTTIGESIAAMGPQVITYVEGTANAGQTVATAIGTAIPWLP